MNNLYFNQKETSKGFLILHLDIFLVVLALDFPSFNLILQFKTAVSRDRGVIGMPVL